MQPDDEGQVRRFGCGDVEIGGPAATHEGGEQDVVPEAGDREQLGDALDEPDDRSFEVGQVGHNCLSREGSWPGALSLRVGTGAQHTCYEAPTVVLSPGPDA